MTAARSDGASAITGSDSSLRRPPRLEPSLLSSRLGPGTLSKQFAT
jgi:hypothetical protein